MFAKMATKEIPSWLSIVVGCFAVKILLIPCYFSTDFDVSRSKRPDDGHGSQNKTKLSFYYFSGSSELVGDNVQVTHGSVVHRFNIPMDS